MPDDLPPRQLTPGGHIFSIDPRDSEVDIWALDEGFHNGPRCESCGRYICMHCEFDWADQPCPGGKIIVLSERALDG